MARDDLPSSPHPQVKFPFRVFRPAHPQCSAVFSDLRLFLGLHHQVSRILGSFRRDVNQSFTLSGLALPRVPPP